MESSGEKKKRAALWDVDKNSRKRDKTSFKDQRTAGGKGWDRDSSSTSPMFFLRTERNLVKVSQVELLAITISKNTIYHDTITYAVTATP